VLYPKERSFTLSEDKITNKPASDVITKKRRIGGVSGIHQRVRAASLERVVNDGATKSNRIGLMLDCSGSMGSHVGRDYRDQRAKTDLLREAVEGFLDACFFGDTACAIHCFPVKDGPTVGLTDDKAQLVLACADLKAGGGTPLADCMKLTLETESISRGVIVSDGVSDDPEGCRETARIYREAGIPVDTVHIGDEENGEELLQDIARITNGLFIKFKDVTQFSKAFKFLTPAFRGMLTSGSVGALELGADEVKK
jgi:Mg-chelatase subunit ChlD